MLAVDYFNEESVDDSEGSLILGENNNNDLLAKNEDNTPEKPSTRLSMVDDSSMNSSIKSFYW